MFERRVIPQRIIGLFLPAICGYLFAYYTIKGGSQPTPGFTKNYGNVDIESIRRNTRSLLSLQSDDSCECKTNFKTNTGLKVNYFGNSFVTNDMYDDAVARRRERLEKWQKREGKRTPIKDDEFSSTDANGNCLEVTDDTVCVNIYAHYGSLLFNYVMNDIEIKFDSNSKKSVTLMSTSLMSINRALEKMTYKSTQYEPTGSTDVITLRYGPHKAQIPVEIKYPKQTILIDPKSGSLDDMVTICIKTFERYPCLNRLITSIRKYYPTIRIIVADDSINFKQITFDRLDHFKMPPGIGFNNGKNLAISQVTTEYLVWIDDDFFFNESTDLVWMLKVLESTDLDLVGGKAGSSRWGYTSIIDRLKGGLEGDCLYRSFGSRGRVEGFPTCQVADVIQNFYMARTLSLRHVGFDGIFQRISHKEFFLDAIGKIKIGYCSNISIGHNHSCLATVQQLNQYSKYREPNDAEINFIDQSWFYRSNLKCISEKKMYGTNKFFNLTHAATTTAKPNNL